MRIFAFSIAAMSLINGTMAHSKIVSQLDERCVARETLACGANAMGYMTWVHQIRSAKDASERASQQAEFDKVRQVEFKSFARLDAASLQAYSSCELFVRAAPDLCVVEVDVPTAEELRSAIREGNEATLKAWLAAIDEQRKE